MSGFLGMRSTSDWPDGDRPKNWREKVLQLYPNGQAALTAMLAFGKKERKDDYEFNWWTKALAEQRGAVTAGEIYTDTLLSSAYTSGGVADDVVYVKVAAATQSEFRVGHQALIRVTGDLAADVQGKVVASVSNGASSYIAVKLLEADDNSSDSDMSDADMIKVSGNINPQGGVTPAAISYPAVKFTNKMQIFRTSLEITRTAMRTRFRTGNKYAEMKREALELHSIEMEWASLLGVQSEGIGDNGHPEYTTDGYITFLRENLSGNVVSWKRDSNYAGKTWLEGGDDWLLDQFELLTRYTDGSAPDYAILAGSGFLKALERLAKANGQIVLQPSQTIGFGIAVTNWVTSFGTFPIKTHPLFSYEASMRNSAVILKPKNWVYDYIDDTKFYGQSGKSYAYTSSGKRIDGLNEEFLTEAGFEYHHPQTGMFLYDVDELNIAV